VNQVNATMDGPSIHTKPIRTKVKAPTVNVHTTKPTINGPSMRVRAPKINTSSIEVPNINARVDGPSVRARPTAEVNVNAPKAELNGSHNINGDSGNFSVPNPFASLNLNGVRHGLNALTEEPNVHVHNPNHDYLFNGQNATLRSPYEDSMAFRSPTTAVDIYDGNKDYPYNVNINKNLHAPLPLILHTGKDYSFGMAHPQAKKGGQYPGHAIEKENNGLYEYKNIYDYDKTREYNKLYEYNVDPSHSLNKSMPGIVSHYTDGQYGGHAPGGHVTVPRIKHKEDRIALIPQVKKGRCCGGGS